MTRSVKLAIFVFVVSAIGAGAIYMASKKKSAATGKYSVADFVGLTRVDMISQLPLRDYSKMSDEQIRTELVNYRNKNS